MDELPAITPSGNGGGSVTNLNKSRIYFEITEAAPDTCHYASVCKLDFENLAGTDRRCAITNVRDVQRAVGSKSDAGRDNQNAALAVDEDLLFAIGQYANKASRSRFRARVSRRVRSFEHIHTIAPIKNQTEHFAQAVATTFS